MAIVKQKKVKGYDAEYFRIIQVNSNMDRNDCVVTFGLYKDLATREADANAVVESYQIDLGEELLGDVYSKGDDTVKNIKLREAYKVFDTKAKAEATKEEEKDESLAWFADAVEA